MTTNNRLSWESSLPLDAVIFDCDGTMTTLEGVDELARNSDVYDQVATMTADAMGKLGINVNLYKKRLELVNPTHTQVIAIGHKYCKHLTPDIQNVVKFFQRLNKPVFLVSAGLFPSVKLLGEHLQIPLANIFAVDIQFDTNGNYISFNHTSPLVTSKGKREIIAEIIKKYPRLLFVGDGLNDYAVYNMVERFVGFGGIFYRENIAKMCEYYIKTPSMLPLLPLALTKIEVGQLAPGEKLLFEKGLQAIQNGDVLMHKLDKQYLAQSLAALGIHD